MICIVQYVKRPIDFFLLADPGDRHLKDAGHLKHEVIFKHKTYPTKGCVTSVTAYSTFSGVEDTVDKTTLIIADVKSAVRTNCQAYGPAVDRAIFP